MTRVPGGAAATLRDPDQPLVQVLRHSACGMLITRRRDGVLLDVNDALATVLGLTREQMVGRTTVELGIYADLADRDRIYATIEQGGLTRLPVLHRHRSGALVELLVTTVPLTLGGEPCGLGFLEDVSDLRRSEEARRAREQELAAAEAERRLLASALEASAKGVLISDADGIIRWVNEAYTRLSGYQREDVLGQSVLMLRSGFQDEGFYRELWDTLRAGRSWHGEVVNLRKDGTVYDEEMTITPVPDEAGVVRHHVAIKQDVTARKREEQSRREEQERYRLALAASRLGTWRHDFLTGRIDLDARAHEHFGTASANPSVDELLAVFHPDDRARTERLIASLRGPDAPSILSNEVRIVSADQPARWLMIDARLDYVQEGGLSRPRLAIATTRDISAEKQAEAALRASEERYRSLVDNLDDLVFKVDLEGRLTFVSHAITQMGYTAEELLGRRVEDFIHPDDRDKMTVDLARLFDGQPLEASEGRWLRVDGKVRHLRVSTRPLIIDGEVVGITGVASDVTRQRETEEQLRAAQRMEAVGRLAGGVAHDFNNLLSVIMAYTEMGMADLREEDPLRADLQEVSAAAQRAAGLTRQLLAFSRRQIMQTEPVHLGGLVAGMSKMLERLIGEDVELQVVVDEPLGQVRVDRGQLEQVVMNLAVNARDAMPAGGVLAIHVGHAHLDDGLAAAAELPPGPYVLVEVADNGCGMTPEVRERIFDPFFTTKPVGKGTGLGLSTVHGIIKQSGGGIAVDSTPGRGTTFRIFLPRLGAGDLRPRETSTRIYTTSGARGRERILVVEDEAALRGVTRRLLTAAGYDVDVAANAGEALLLCEERGRDIDLVLTDVVMPGLSGPKLAERLVALCPRARVLFMSGYTDEALAQHDVQEAPFLRKPFDRQSLIATVRAALDARQAAGAVV